MEKVYEGLLKVQRDLKAPKGQYNSFGKYKYRSCEDILEAVKPLLLEEGLVLTITDQLEVVAERYYVRSSATLRSVEDGSSVTCEALAREDKDKKGMDGAQVTGSTSSYARKYALNGLFLIDDTKDSDATNDHGASNKTNAVMHGNHGKPKTKRPADAPVAAVPPTPDGITEAELSEMRATFKNYQTAIGATPSVAMDRAVRGAGIKGMGADISKGDYRSVMLYMAKAIAGSALEG